MAAASLPTIRARSRLGTAIAARMPMIATTIRSSISVKPWIGNGARGRFMCATSSRNHEADSSSLLAAAQASTWRHARNDQVDQLGVAEHFEVRRLVGEPVRANNVSQVPATECAQLAAEHLLAIRGH